MKHYFKSVHLLTLFLSSMLFFTSCSTEDEATEEDDPILELLPPITLDCDYFEEDRVLENDPNRPVDFIITCWTRIEGSLKVEPGVVIAFENNAGMLVDLDNKVFEITGTADEPVTLTGTSPQRGYWKGIFFTEAHNLNNIIEHTVIEYAGSQAFSSYYEGSLALRGVSGTTPQALTLNHVEISNGGSVGLDFSGITTNATVATSNLTITGNEDVPVKVSASMAHVFNNTSSFAGNDSDFFNITTSYYNVEDQTVSWQKFDVPYLVDGRVSIGDDGHLTIEAGVEMQLKSGAYLQPYGFLPPYNLSLKIMGTAEEPVHLKAHNGTNWGGIQYGFTQENNIIDHAIIENAKGDFPVGNIQNTGAIYMHASPALTVSNTSFVNLQNCAFYGYTSTPFENLTTVNVTFDNVGQEYCED